jgi:hypothetical protein
LGPLIFTENFMYNRPPFNKFGMSPQNLAQALERRGNASNVLGMAPRAPMMVPPASVQPSASAGGPIPVGFMNTPDGQTPPGNPPPTNYKPLEPLAPGHTGMEGMTPEQIARYGGGFNDNTLQIGLGNQIGMGQQNAMNAFGRTMTPNQPKPQFGLSPQVSNAKMGY